VKIPTGEATLGPFFPPRYVDAGANDLTQCEGRKAKGEAIEVAGVVRQEDGAPLDNLVLEIWQCNAAGRYIHPNDDEHAPVDRNFYGAARLLTDDSGSFKLRTVKPGAYPVPTRDGWWRPPHVHFSLFGKVWLSRLVTQMYFEGEPLNAHDRILNAVPDPAARDRLVARLAPPRAEPFNELIYEHEIVLRGRKATPAQQ